MNLNEYEVVRATKSLNINVPVGSIGTILIVHESPYLAYIVEFMEGGQSLDVLTVMPEDIELLTPDELQLLVKERDARWADQGQFR